MVGFALGIIGGVLLGVVIGSSKLAYDVAYPLLIGFASIPKVAVVPILVLWFGAGTVIGRGRCRVTRCGPSGP
jgi:NitT/TauT family transport system permease protein